MADTRTDAEIKACNLHAALSSLLESYKDLRNDTNSWPMVEYDSDPDKIAEKALFENAPLADWEPPVTTNDVGGA